MLRRTIALLLATSLASGCASIGVTREKGDAAGPASLAVSIYEHPADREGGKLAPLPVYSELVALTDGAQRPVARSLSPRWAIDSLAPGRYLLRVTKRLDAQGNIADLSNPGSKDIALSSGERASASVVLKKVPVVWIVLAAVTVVTLIALSIHWANEGKIPTPPKLHLPPLGVVAIDLSLAPGVSRGPEPGAVDVFPAPDSVVAARRVAVTFLMSRPLDAEGLGRAVSALGTRSGEIEGVVSYLPHEQLLRFLPSADFQAGEDVTVTLDLEKVSSAGGRHGSGKTSTHFRVAP